MTVRPDTRMMSRPHEHNTTETRHLLSAYTLSPASRPGTYRVICVVLYKGRLQDEDSRAIFWHHITIGYVPEVHQAADEVFRTMTFVTMAPDANVLALCAQFRTLCQGRHRTPFVPPLIDGQDDTVATLTVTPAEWENSCQIMTALREAIQTDHDARAAARAAAATEAEPQRMIFGGSQ